MDIDPALRQQHPELGWAAADSAPKPPVSEPPVPDGSHEEVVLPPHGKEPVTQAPEYTRNTPLAEVGDALKAKVNDLTPEDVHSTPPKLDPAAPKDAPPAAPQLTPATTKERKHWPKWVKAGAIAGGVAIVGGGIVLAVTRGGGNGDSEKGVRAPASTSAGLGNTALSGGSSPEVSSPAPETSPAETLDANGHPPHRNSDYPDLQPAYWHFRGQNNPIPPIPITGTDAETVYERMVSDWNAMNEIGSDDATIQKSIVELYGAPLDQLNPDIQRSVRKVVDDLFLYRFHTDPSYNPVLQRKLLNSSYSPDKVVLVDQETELTGAKGTSYERFTLTRQTGSSDDKPTWVITGWENLQPGDTSLGD